MLGQILTYAFIVTDLNLNIQTELCGHIRLNKTQLPEIDAILTNKIDVLNLQQHGDLEYIAAEKIHKFLSKIINENGRCELVGFNSNSFDLAFLRNLLIKYGLNPYFMGKLGNKDILHYTQSIAFNFPDNYPWTLQTKDNRSYYSFKLEDTCKSFNIINQDQSHDAKEDVLITISLVKTLQSEFNTLLTNFNAICLPENLTPMSISKQKTRHFPNKNETAQKFTNTYWLTINKIKNAYLLFNLSKFKENNTNTISFIDNIRYINPNKHFLHLQNSSLTEQKDWTEIIKDISENNLFKELSKNPEHYFDLIKKDWDIEYQITELGFAHIDTLKTISTKLIKDPQNYLNQLSELIKSRKTTKDNYLIQLFNRNYLNTHPNPKIEHLHKYLIPRYITGELYRDWDNFTSLPQNYERLEYLTKKNEDTTEKDSLIMLSLKKYYDHFIKENELSDYCK
ncbi:hypothetical protein DID75_03450 [Candidatus Marinamargulisbacteria bacterium SCGC AG-410-N11]|nr:hypothetical protein DID75_03450 [Candidatus Marinamargulisbacteria bacterium SCGC AG-410-N11]